MAEREKVEIINVWAVNDIKADHELLKFLDALTPEQQASAALALKQCYILAFKKGLQHAVGALNNEAVKAEMAKQENVTVNLLYQIANAILSLGTQKL